MTINDILMRVAQAKAQDCADRNFFSHTDPEGYGPNYHVRQAGYILPDWYGKELDANNIESLHAGSADPAIVLDGWLHSDSHRKHVLGLHPFFAEQVNVGIGYAQKVGTQYTHYWAFISAVREVGNGT